MIEAFLSVLLISLISLSVLFLIFFGRFNIEKNIYYMISFAAGTMLATSFFDIIPEVLNEMGTVAVSYVFLGIILFLLIEKYIHWHHCNIDYCRRKHKRVKPYVFLNLLGDGLHNFIDGAIIVAAYAANFKLGILTTLSITLHELPQEIGDFSILLKGGLKFKKALLFNFLTVLTAFLGAIAAIILGKYIELTKPILLCIAAGSFIYLSLADMIPETYKDVERGEILKQTVIMVFSIIMVYLLIIMVPE